MSKNKIAKIIAGAVIGTLLGAAGAKLFPKRRRLLDQMRNQSRGWQDTARDLGETVVAGVKNWTYPEKEEVDYGKFSAGAILGLLFGAGAALLLTPKTGRQLRRDLAERYEDISDQTQEFVEHFHQNGSIPRKKAAVKHAKKSHAIVKKARAKIKPSSHH